MSTEERVEAVLDNMFDMLQAAGYPMQITGTVETKDVIGRPELHSEVWSAHISFQEHSGPAPAVINVQIAGMEQHDVSERMHIITLVTMLEELSKSIRNNVLNV